MKVSARPKVSLLFPEPVPCVDLLTWHCMAAPTFFQPSAASPSRLSCGPTEPALANPLLGMTFVFQAVSTFWHWTGGSAQDHPQEKKCKKAKWLSEEALQIAVKRREAKGKGEKERYTHLNAEFQRTARRKPSSVINANKYRETIEWERLEISSRKLEIPREHFMQRWPQ